MKLTIAVFLAACAFAHALPQMAQFQKIKRDFGGDRDWNRKGGHHDEHFNQGGDRWNHEGFHGGEHPQQWNGGNQGWNGGNQGRQPGGVGGGQGNGGITEIIQVGNTATSTNGQAVGASAGGALTNVNGK